VTPLAGRVALVTGASRGIGAAVATALGSVGATVVRVARSLAEGRQDGWLDLRCDLTDESQVAALAHRVRAETGLPGIVVNCAGSFLLRPLAETTAADFDAQIGVNLRGAFLLAREILPAMAGAGGLFVSIGSVADHAGFPDNAAYAAGKYGLRGLHETLLAEYRGTRARLTLVSPGPTDTGIWDRFDPDSRPGFPRRSAMLRPADVADAVLFVATRPPHVQVDWLRLGPA